MSSWELQYEHVLSKSEKYSSSARVMQQQTSIFLVIATISNETKRILQSVSLGSKEIEFLASGNVETLSEFIWKFRKNLSERHPLPYTLEVEKNNVLQVGLYKRGNFRNVKIVQTNSGNSSSVEVQYFAAKRLVWKVFPMLTKFRETKDFAQRGLFDVNRAIIRNLLFKHMAQSGLYHDTDRFVAASKVLHEEWECTLLDVNSIQAVLGITHPKEFYRQGELYKILQEEIHGEEKCPHDELITYLITLLTKDAFP